MNIQPSVCIKNYLTESNIACIEQIIWARHLQNSQLQDSIETNGLVIKIVLGPFD